MRSRFKDLVAYQRAIAVADAVHRLVMEWPEIDRRTSGVQLLRSVDSIGANIAEASGRWTKAERRRFLLTARASLYETEHWLDRARARHLPTPDTDDLEIAAKALSGLIRRHS